MNSAAKVGLLVVVFVVLVVAGFELLGKSLISKKPHVYFAELADEKAERETEDRQLAEVLTKLGLAPTEGDPTSGN